MNKEKQKRILIYKMTHNSDPDPKTGVLGIKDCMGRIRGWSFDAVIGVGGIGHEAKRNGIDGKLIWIGIGPHKSGGTKLSKCKGTKRCKCKRTKPRGPLVTYDHFMYCVKKDKSLENLAPYLARRMYKKNVRYVMDSLSDKERFEVENILKIAKDAPPSN